jgi:MFS transporter, PPP family, 3-phenylpropionic acid transporter
VVWIRRLEGHDLRPTALPRFMLLYAAMYAAFGVASPFLPAFVSMRGLSAEELGLVLSAGTAVRLLTAPLAGRIGDVLQGRRVVLVVCTALAASVTLGYLPAHGLWPLLALSLGHAAALGPVTILADALALGAASPPPGSGRRGFEYGWVRGTGSAAFIIGTLLSGQAVSAWGLDVIVWLQALLLGTAAVAAILVPELRHDRPAAAVRAPAGGVRLLLQLPRFRTLVLVAALILGSHAMHDAFAVIRWRASGVSPATVSGLWSASVAAEVLVFFIIGPTLVTWLTPAGALAVAALAGMLRWAVMAQSAAVMALALVQPLHGITFALLHLACMRLLACTVPQGLEGTAQALYGTVGIGAAAAVLTLVSGALYARVGAQGFWVMAALCALALPLSWTLRLPACSERRTP